MTGQRSCSSATTYRVEVFVKGTEPKGPCWPFRIPEGEFDPIPHIAGEQIWRETVNGREIRFERSQDGRVRWEWAR